MSRGEGRLAGALAIALGLLIIMAMLILPLTTKRAGEEVTVVRVVEEKPLSPFVKSIVATPVKVPEKMFPDDVAGFEDASRLVIPPESHFVLTNETAHSGEHCLKGYGSFQLLFGYNRSDFNLYDKFAFYIKVAEAPEGLKGFTIVFSGAGYGYMHSLPLRELFEVRRSGIVVNITRCDGDWLRVEISNIDWGEFSPYDKLDFALLPYPLDLKGAVFYLDDVQLYASKTDACLLKIEIEDPITLQFNNESFRTFYNYLVIENLNSNATARVEYCLVPSEYLASGLDANMVYAPIKVDVGDRLRVHVFSKFLREGASSFNNEEDQIVFVQTFIIRVESP